MHACMHIYACIYICMHAFLLLLVLYSQNGVFMSVTHDYLCGLGHGLPLARPVGLAAGVPIVYLEFLWVNWFSFWGCCLLSLPVGSTLVLIISRSQPHKKKKIQFKNFATPIDEFFRSCRDSRICMSVSSNLMSHHHHES